eukprot:m.40549 g.40549  ORF g.40549 m.40549 type:complete len:603 (-) comp10362_c0_seq3:42-1850(-)
MSDQRAAFDQAVTAMLQHFRAIDKQYPALVGDMKKTIQAMYTSFATVAQQYQLRREKMAHFQTENAQLKDEVVSLVSFRGKYNDTLLDALSGVKALLANPEAVSSSHALEELKRSVDRAVETTEDSVVWQKKVHKLYVENATLRDRIELLENDCADLSASIEVLKRELCGRIQQVQLFSQGLAKTDNATYSRLLSEMQQNTMKAMAQAESRRQRHESLVASFHQQQSSDPSSSTAPTAAEKKSAKSRREKREVVIHRGNSGVGMRIQGGLNETGVFTPVLVDTVYPDSPADKCGSVFVGDEISSIGTQQLNNMKHTDIINIFKECGEDVKLTLVSSVDVADPGVARRRAVQRGVQYLKTSSFEDAVHLFTSIIEEGEHQQNSDAKEDKREHEESNNSKTKRGKGAGPVVYSYRASGLLALGKHNDAEKDCRTALSLKVIPLPLYVMSRICEARGQLHEALQLVSFACRLDKHSASLRAHKVHVEELIMNSQKETEKKAMATVEDLHGDNPPHKNFNKSNTMPDVTDTNMASTGDGEEQASMRNENTAAHMHMLSHTPSQESVLPTSTRTHPQGQPPSRHLVPHALLTTVSMQDQDVDDFIFA